MATEKLLTEEDIGTLPPGEHPDGGGLMLRVRPNGVRSWILRYGDRYDRVTLAPADGRLGTLKLAKARVAARQKRGEIHAAGSSAKFRAKVEAEAAQRREEKAARAAQKQGTTFGALATKLVDKAKLRPKTRTGWVSILKASIIPTLGAKKATAITKEDIRRALQEITDRSVWAADSAHKLLSWVFTLAVQRDLLPASPMVGIRRRDFRVKNGGRRSVVASSDQLRRLWAASADSSAYSRAVRLAMVTLTRREEIFEAEISEFDFAGADVTEGATPLRLPTWTLPGSRTKNGEPLAIPLTKEAVSIARSLIAEAQAIGSRYLLPGTTGHRLPTSKEWAALMVRAELSAERPKAQWKKKGTEAKPRRAWTPHPVRFHDLRRTGRSILETTLEFPASVAEAVIGHVAPSLQQTYSPHGVGLKQRREAMEAWAAYLADVVGKAPTSNVLTGTFGDQR